jgi:hypothetical protein
MAFQSFSSVESSINEGDAKSAMQDMFGPGAVDQQIRAAISTCWMMFPKDKRSPEAVAIEVRRILERALSNLKEDAQVFGFNADG